MKDLAISERHDVLEFSSARLSQTCWRSQVADFPTRKSGGRETRSNATKLAKTIVRTWDDIVYVEAQEENLIGRNISEESRHTPM